MKILFSKTKFERTETFTFFRSYNSSSNASSQGDSDIGLLTRGQYLTNMLPESVQIRNQNRNQEIIALNQR